MSYQTNSGLLTIRRLALAVALTVAVAALSACGTAAEPPTAAPEQATTAPAAVGGTESPASEDTAPAGRLAPAFELPNAAGETVSLASYAGDSNVVLVFYRGFW